jgi:hypothetical protein
MGRVNGFLQKMKRQLVNVRQDGTGVAHYDTEKDVMYLPRQRDSSTTSTMYRR